MIALATIALLTSGAPRVAAASATGTASAAMDASSSGGDSSVATPTPTTATAAETTASSPAASVPSFDGVLAFKGSGVRSVEEVENLV